MDFTGAQMVLTLKLISLAVCYQDGLKPEQVPRCPSRKPCYAGAGTLQQYDDWVSYNVEAWPARRGTYEHKSTKS